MCREGSKISVNLESFCFDHGLGKVIHISPLSGGFMQKMFQVKTDKGVYAIKILNPEVMSRSEAKEISDTFI